jgi:hypothetical protein
VFEVRSSRFEVRSRYPNLGSKGSRFDYVEVREVRGSEISGSFQHYLFAID